MRQPLIIVTGTGTGIGKTHVACAILRGASARPAFGYKPVESGLVEGTLSDAARLARASSFHVQHTPGLRLAMPISPHRAAAFAGLTLDWAAVRAFVDELRTQAPVLVELPGGLFTPLAAGFRNAEAVRSLDASLTLLLAPNRLGVLHDVGAALEGASRVGARIDSVGLVAATETDASTPYNADDVAQIAADRWAGAWPRGAEEELATHPTTAAIVRRWLLTAV